VAQAAKFCGQCGAALPRTCATCGSSNPPDAKFCSDCGASLSPGGSRKAATTPSLAAKVPKTSSAERRQITIMFCYMVSPTALSNKLDPEEQRDAVSAFLSACATEIKRLGGMVANYLGDGMLAYFGYPTAHEDDAERGVRAGLAILDVIGKLNPRRT
jgi:class 3 adenylate cyclase